MLPTTTKYSLKRALWIIGLSTVLCSGIPTASVLGYKIIQRKHLASPAYNLTKIAQTGPYKEAIKTEHLEEILNLSQDSPQNLYGYSLSNGLQKLLKSGLVSQAHLSIEPPNTLVVDYTAREPVAYIGDYNNLVVDKSGSFFPLSPFFTPKILPKIYLGMRLDPLVFGQPFSDEKMEVALKILDFIQRKKIKNQKLELIDVSNLRANTLGKQEIVVHLQEHMGDQNFQRILRLSVNEYCDEIDHYMSLKQMGMASDLVIDLRMMPSAYLTPLESVVPQ